MATCLTCCGITFPNGQVQWSPGQVAGGSNFYFNCCLVCCGPHITNSMCGWCGTWTAPTCASVITFELWSGGGGGAGHCCQNCYCDMASCGAYGGYYGRRTIRRIDGQWQPGCVYCYCLGAGGDGTTNSGCGCFTACCAAARGCATWVCGAGAALCVPGAQGGYNIYCSCRCNNQGNRSEGMCNLGMCYAQTICSASTTWDFVDLGDESAFIKTRGNCDCNSRHVSTSASYGISNGHTYHIEDSMAYCGCTNCCRGFRQISMGGSNSLKSYCGNFLCNCLGTAGKPGAVRISWS